MADLSPEEALLNEAFDQTPWDRSALGVVREALREFLGDGEGIDELVLSHLLDAASADGLREAADNMYLTRAGQHNEAAAMWLRRRADLIDPRTRAEAQARELAVEQQRSRDGAGS